MMRYSLILFVLINSFSFADTTGSIELKKSFIADPVTGQEEYYRLIDNYSTPPLQFIFYNNGTIKQIEDYRSTSTAKLAIKTKSNLQLESIDNIDPFLLYGRQWQTPKNGSFLITQYPVTESGLPDFDNPKRYVLSATGNTILSIQWIREGFQAYPVPNYRYIVLRWDENQEDDLSHYNIYRSDFLDGEYVKINTENIYENYYEDFYNLEKGKTYYYKATAVDTSGNESEFSQYAKSTINF